MKVLISTSSFGKHDPIPIRLLENTGFEIESNPYGRTLKIEESIRMLKGAVGLIAGTEPLSGEVLRSASSLRTISRCGSGLDNIDMEAARELGISVYNTPDAPAEAVAELTLGLIFSALRGIAECDRKIRSGRWEKKMGRLLSRKSIGIIGLGRVGRKLVEFLRPFDVNIYAYDIVPDRAFSVSHNIQMAGLEELCKNSDIISIHITGGKENQNLIGESLLSLMKRGSYLINTSRGDVVDERALAEHLRDNLAGAALDVFEVEPYEGKLKELDNVVLTSHIGSYAKEARIKMELEAVHNLLNGLEARK